jgi:hypothetical protein
MRNIWAYYYSSNVMSLMPSGGGIGMGGSKGLLLHRDFNAYHLLFKFDVTYCSVKKLTYKSDIVCIDW